MSENTSVLIRSPGPGDARSFLAGVRRSRSLHHPWVAPPDSPRAFAAYLERLASGNHYGFLVVRRADEQVAGVINLNNVIRGAFQSAFLGYYAFLPYAGQGLMRKGMVLVVQHAFTRLKLHRLEANVQSANLRSRCCGNTVSNERAFHDGTSKSPAAGEITNGGPSCGMGSPGLFQTPSKMQKGLS